MAANLWAVRALRASIAVGILAVAVIVVGSAGAASRKACNAPGTQPPNVGAGNNFLTGVASSSACTAWAVGYYHKGTRYLPLLERWSGRAWKIEPTRNPGGSSRLLGVTATSANNAWAVGQRAGGALIEHWNGKAWKIQQRPCHECSLRAVAATSATSAWAVGFGPVAGGALIEHWNGKAWKAQPSACPISADECQLNAVAATSATSAWAVGAYTVHGSGATRMLIERWNGKAWKVQPSPNPPSDNGGALTGVAATSATNAWAVGSYFDQGVGALTFIEHWNGHAWKIKLSPNPGGGNGSELNAVAATSATNAWAVGDIDFTNGMDKTLIERWNGKAWGVQPSPNPGSKSNALDGVAGTSVKDAWAVGAYHNATTKPPARNLALHWNGSSWGG